MKKFIILVLALSLGSTLLSGFSAGTDKKVSVYYFHFSRRCATCVAVETETKKSLEALYPDQMKKNNISFQSVNLDEKESDALAAQLKIEGQTLLVVSGEKKKDLTSEAFMYALNKPEKLKTEIKKAVDGFLK